jgi:hypothetical protein
VWREDAADWVSRVLGISVARAGSLVAVFEVDGRDGEVRATLCRKKDWVIGEIVKLSN